MVNYFRRARVLMGRIFHHWEDPVVRSRRGILDEEQSCGAVMDDDELGVVVQILLLLLFFPFALLRKGTRNYRAASQTAAWQQHGQEETPVKQKRGEEWPPLWECCKLCFPEALGIPHQSWNLQAWKTESPEAGAVRYRTSLDHKPLAFTSASDFSSQVDDYWNPNLSSYHKTEALAQHKWVQGFKHNVQTGTKQELKYVSLVFYFVWSKWYWGIWSKELRRVKAKLAELLSH